MTKKSRYLIGTAILAAVVGSVAAGASFAGSDREGYHHYSGGAFGGHHGKGRHGARAFEMFQRFDRDRDGKVTQEEVDALRNDKFKAFDRDAGGELTIDEFQGLWLEMARPRMVDHFQRLDGDGDGKVTRDEYDRPFAFMMSRHDRNGDGVVTMKELRRGSHGDRYDDDDNND